MGVTVVGDARADWAILTDLAGHWLAVEAAHHAPEVAAQVSDWKAKSAKRNRKARSGPEHRPWNYTDAQQVYEEIGKAVPYYAELRWDNLGELGMQWPLPLAPRQPRRVEPVEVPPAPALPDGGLWLVSGPLLWDSSVFMEHAAEEICNLIPTPFVALSPADFKSAGLTEGEPVTVGSEYGSVSLVVKADDSVQPGTAWIPVGLAGAPAETLGARRAEPVVVTVTR